MFLQYVASHVSFYHKILFSLQQNLYKRRVTIVYSNIVCYSILYQNEKVIIFYIRVNYKYSSVWFLLKRYARGLSSNLTKSLWKN